VDRNRLSIGLLCGAVPARRHQCQVAAAERHLRNTSNCDGGRQNGAVVVSLSSTDAGATILYTVDAAYLTILVDNKYLQAPFLVSSNLTVKASALQRQSGKRRGEPDFARTSHRNSRLVG